MLVPPFPLVVQVDGADHIAWTPPAHYRRRGMVVALVLPVAVWLLVFLIWSRAYRPSEAFASALVSFGVGASGLLVIVGGVMAALAGVLARRTVVRFDRARRVVRRERDGVELAWTTVNRVRSREAAMGRAVLELVDAGGAVLMRLATVPSADDRIGPTLRRIQGLLEESSYRHGHAVAADIDRTPPEPPLGERTAAALLCIPLLGTHVFAPLYFRATSDTRPLVTHHAQQSGRNLLFMLGGFLVLAIVFGTPSILTEGTPHHRIAITVFIAVVVVHFLAYVVSSCIAFLQALRGERFHIPWLKLFWRKD